MERHNFLVLSLLSSNELGAFLELLRRTRECVLRRHFECWQRAYVGGYLDMPSLVDSSEDEGRTRQQVARATAAESSDDE